MQPEQRRLLPVDPAFLTDEQQEVVDGLSLGPNGIQEPVGLLLHNPSLAAVVHPVLTRLRNRSVLSDKLRELAILIAAQVWQQGFEWQVHKQLALAAGLGAEVIAAISHAQTSLALDDEEAAVHDFCRQLHDTRTVDDEVYRRVEAVLGKAGIMELCWLSGSYASLAMIMNVAGSPPAWATAIEA